MIKFRMDKRKILQRITRGLQWENKPLKLKRSISDKTSWETTEIMLYDI